MNSDNNNGINKKKVIQIILALFWIAIIVLAICFRDKFTVDGIVSLTPKSTIPAIVILWILYGIKSLSVVMYSAVLSAASGVLFPLYIAIPVSIIGVMIMMTIPYIIGKKLGEEGCKSLLEKYPKLQIVNVLKDENDFLFCLATRILGVLPSDPLSALCGAMGIKYKTYILASTIGMLPETLAYTILGTSIDEVGSPLFYAAIAIRGSFIIFGLLLNRYLIKKAKNESVRADEEVPKE